jgi:RNA polymerase sigma-70 factor, ECF subfamily
MELLDAHGAAAMAMLRRLCGSRHDADDVFQETAARVWRSLPNQPRLRNARGWLMTVAYRVFVDSRERRKPHDELSDPPDARADPPDRAAARAEVCDRVQAAIAGLPEPVREVVVLHYLGGLTLSQTAAAMHVREGTVKSRLNAALGQLRSVLEGSQ